MQLAVRLFLVVFGLLFVGLGYYVGVGMAGAARASADRAERLAPADAAALAAAAPGGELLIEGVVSPENPARFRDFVAYVREEFRGADNNGDERWFEDERVTPPLAIEAGGRAQLANDDYELEGPHERWQEEGLEWSRSTEEGTKRYRGLVAGGPVTAIGTVAPGPAGNELRAEVVYGGTREQYIAEKRGLSSLFPAVGLAIAAAGAALVFVAAWVLRRWR